MVVLSAEESRIHVWISFDDVAFKISGTFSSVTVVEKELLVISLRFSG